MQKYYQLPILSTMGISGHIKNDNANLMFICMQKMNSIPNFFFKIL